MKKNVASQVIGAQMVNASTGAAFTGSVTVYVTGDGGTQAVGSVGSGACTHEGNGYHTYAPAQAETNYDLVAFTFTGTGAVPVTVQVYTTFPQTGDNYARLGAPAGASVSADIAAVKSETATILTDTNELQGDWTNGGRLDLIIDAILVDTGTTLETHLTDIKGATFSGATDSLEAIRDRGDAAWTTGAGGTPPQLLQSTTIATLASQTSFTLTAGSADNDAYNGAIAVVTDSATSTQKCYATVSDYVGSTRTVTLSADPGIFTMAVGDSISLITPLGSAGSGPTAAQIADAVWDEAQADHVSAGSFGVIASEIADILVDTAEIGAAGAGLTNINLPDQTMNITGNITGNLSGSVGSVTGTVGGIAGTIQTLDALDTAQDTQHSTTQSAISALNDPTAAAIADAVWDELQSGHVTGGSFGEIATEIASILADTNELQTDWANGGRLDLIVDGILADTAEIGTAGAGLTDLGGMSTAMKAEVNAEMVDVIATDTYAEPGQGAPAATASLAAKINYLYKNWRNKRTQTATTESLYDDAGTTVDQKRTVSDDGTTATKGEMSTGP